MENTPTILHMPHSTVLIRNIDAVQNYVVNTLHSTRKEIGEGIAIFKDGLAGKMHNAGIYINRFVLPVNNFI